MFRVKTKYLRVISRRFWGIFFSCIIAFAVVVQIGRQAFPLMNDYRHLIAEALGDQLGVEIEIESITAEWRGLRPEVVLSGLSVLSKERQVIFTVAKAQAELSILDSFLQEGFAWRTITFESLETSFEQRKNNTWHIRGYSGGTANTDNPFSFDDPLDIFLFGRRVNIVSATLNFDFYNGKQSQIAIPEIRLDNDRFFHRMTAVFNLEETESLRVVVEGYGDPRNKEKFAAVGYARLKDVPTSDIYSALVLSETHKDTPLDLPGRNKVNVELWFKGSLRSGMTAKGRLSVDGLPAELDDVFDFPEKLVTNFSAAWNDRSGWFLNLQDIELDWVGREMPVDTIAFYGKSTTAGMRVSEIDVGDWVDMALSSIHDQESELYKAISALHPTGILRNLDIQLTSPEQGYFSLKSYVEDGAVNDYKGNPEFRNVDGYIETNLRGGFADISVKDDFYLHVKRAYDKPFVFDDVDGQLSWRTDLDKKIAYLNSSLIKGSYQESPIRAAFAMTLPFSQELGEARMDLTIHADSGDVVDHALFVPNNIPPELNQWLGDALTDGTASDINLLFSGSLDQSPKYPASYQFATTVAMKHFRFDHYWPVLEDVKGMVMIDSNVVSARLFEAEMQGNIVNKASFFMPEAATDKEMMMYVNLDTHGDLKNAKKTILDSPLREIFEPVIRTWKLQGNYQAAMQLQIPLIENEDKLDYDIVFSLDDANLYMEEEALLFENIGGNYHYAKVSLLESDTFSASLWGEVFQVNFSSDIERRIVDLNFNGRVNTPALKAWMQRPEMVFLNGDFDTHGVMHIPHDLDSGLDFTTMKLYSDLKDADISLPQPFQKPPGEEVDYQLEIIFEEAMTRYAFALNDILRGKLNQTETDLALAVAIGDTSEPMPDLDWGTLRINGVLANAVYEDWGVAIERYEAEFIAIEEAAKARGEPPLAQDELLTESALLIQQLNLAELVFEDLNLAITGSELGWILSGQNDLFVGEIFVPIDVNDRVQVNIDYLSLFEEYADIDTSELEQVSSLTDIDFADIDPADVQIAQLKMEKEDWGRWNFSVDPIENGLEFSNVHGEIRNLKLGQKTPATFVWTADGDIHTSHFIGDITAKDVGDVLVAWEQERLLESTEAKFSIDASWDEPPDMVSLTNIYGDISLEMTSGSFIRGAEAGENPLLRLIALFNFDTIARRLRLDFSDLAAKGFAYDKVKSDLSFANGIVTFSDPLIVESSSSKMQMAGTIDLIEEDIDSELVVTLPVAGNLAVATAFIAGLPAGLGVYVVSKMFDKQVDKVSSINYSIAGSWDDPKIKVRKVFDDTAAKKKGDKLKKNKKPSSEDKVAEN